MEIYDMVKSPLPQVLHLGNATAEALRSTTTQSQCLFNK